MIVIFWHKLLIRQVGDNNSSFIIYNTSPEVRATASIFSSRHSHLAGFITLLVCLHRMASGVMGSLETEAREHWISQSYDLTGNLNPSDHPSLSLIVSNICNSPPSADSIEFNLLDTRSPIQTLETNLSSEITLMMSSGWSWFETLKHKVGKHLKVTIQQVYKQLLQLYNDHPNVFIDELHSIYSTFITITNIRSNLTINYSLINDLQSIPLKFN